MMRGVHTPTCPCCGAVCVQNLYVMDLPGEHTLRVDGSIMGKGHKARDAGVCVPACVCPSDGLPRPLRVVQVRLWPGWTVDLSGGGRDLYYQVYRDAHAHA
jgi:hypothetical protein